MSSSAPPIINTTRLYERLDPAFDYTNHDVIVETLLDVIKCPIALEISDMMIVFNDQCYDVILFDGYKADEYVKSKRRTDSG